MRGRYEPTFYGQLIASCPLSFDASVLVLKFGNAGMIREGILLGIIMDTQPLPILHPFGEEILFSKHIASYFTDRTILAGRKEMEFMANFCAFEFWQHLFRDKYRFNHLKQVLEIENVYPTKALMPKLKEDWCSLHNLSQSSLHQTLEICMFSTPVAAKILSSFRGLPPYFDPYEYEHTCLVTCQGDGNIDGVSAYEEGIKATGETKCASVPYVTSEEFHSYDVARMFTKIIKEVV
ncbi:Zinc finger CCCH domain-containing protein [Arachis hypogaea]|nr:Zinc finger CCCH domain-containing protein [Arachis hypogaea]